MIYAKKLLVFSLKIYKNLIYRREVISFKKTSMENKRKICQFCNNSYVNLWAHQKTAKFCLKIQGETSGKELLIQKEMYEKQIEELTTMYEKRLEALQRLLPKSTSDDTAPVVPLTNKLLENYSINFTIRNLLDGADGHLKYCKYVFSQNKYVELNRSKRNVVFFTDPNNKKVDCQELAHYIVSSLKNQSIKLARDQLPKLFTKRDEIMRSSTSDSLKDVVDNLEEINTDISILTQIQENYEENFDTDYYKLLSFKIIKELRSPSERKFDLHRL